MKIDIRFFLREVYQGFKRNFMLNLTSVSTVMILIFQVGFFYLTVANINNFTSSISKKLQITAILTYNLDLIKAGKLKAKIIKHKDVEAARYMSKRQNLLRLKSKMRWRGNLSNLSKNPLPDTIEVDLKNPDNIETVASEIKKYPGVKRIRYGNRQLVRRLLNLSNRIYTIGIIIIIMLSISAIFLISNTIRLTVFSRRKEIEIMELVGAPHWFIRGPFIVEGFIQGVIGSIIAVIFLSSLYTTGTHWFLEGIRFIPIIPASQILIGMSVILIFIGIGIGTISSFVSVSKYLKI